VFGDVVADLQTCVADPIGCRDPNTFEALMTNLDASAPNVQVVQLLAKALIAAPGNCLTGGGAPDNPFCASPDRVFDVYSHHVAANPDVAISLLPDIINAWVANTFDRGRVLGSGNGMIDRAFALIVANVPTIARNPKSAVPARIILFLQDLSETKAVPELTAIAADALQKLAEEQQKVRQQKQDQQANVQRQQQFLQQQALAIRDRKILIGAVIGAFVLGGGAFFLGRWASKSGTRMHARHA